MSLDISMLCSKLSQNLLHIFFYFYLYFFMLSWLPPTTAFFIVPFKRYNFLFQQYWLRQKSLVLPFITLTPIFDPILEFFTKVGSFEIEFNTKSVIQIDQIFWTVIGKQNISVFHSEFQVDCIRNYTTNWIFTQKLSNGVLLY